MALKGQEFVDEVLQKIKEIKKACQIVNEPYMESGNSLKQGAIRECIFEANLREDYSRKTTFASDFAIAEPFGIDSVLETYKTAVAQWCDNKEYFAELILVTNQNAWYFDARKQADWSKLYIELYYTTRDLFFDHLGDNQEAMDYYYDYVD